MSHEIVEPESPGVPNVPESPADSRSDLVGAPDTRESILTAALETFAERGFDGAKTRDIAQRAGVNLGLIQYHFGNKDQLWRAAVDRAFERLRSGVTEVLADPTVIDERERARRLIRDHVRFVAGSPEFVRMMHEEGKRTGPRMRWLVDRHVKPLYDAITALLAQSRTLRVLPDGVPPIHFHYILAGAVGLIFHQAEECKRLSGIDPTDEETIENHVRAVEFLFFGPEDSAAPNPNKQESSP